MKMKEREKGAKIEHTRTLAVEQVAKFVDVRGAPHALPSLSRYDCVLCTRSANS